MREVIKSGNGYILPVQNLKIQEYIFWSGFWHSIKLHGDDEYTAQFTLESGDVYNIDGKEIENFSEYILSNPFANEMCLNAIIYLNGTLEITFIRHKIIIYADPDFESWSFGDSNEIRIYCLPKGDFMTFGLQNLFVNIRK